MGVQTPMRKVIFRGHAAVKYRDFLPVSCAKTAEPMEMPLWKWIWVGPRKHVLDGDAHWRHIWRIRLNRPAAMHSFCQITFTTCYYFTDSAALSALNTL